MPVLTLSAMVDGLSPFLTYLLLAVLLLVLVLLAVAVGRWLRHFIRRDQLDDDSPTTLTGLRRRHSRLQQQVDSLRTVLRLSAELNANLNFTRGLDLTLELAAAALGASQPEDSHLASALLLFEGHELVVNSSRGLAKLDQRVRLIGKAGVLAEALAYVERRICLQPARDPELRRIVGFIKCSRVVCLPLVFGYDAYGVLLFGHPAADYFDGERLEMLDAIAQQAVVALNNARLYSDLALEKERITQIQEEARKKLARDLHDGPAQSLGAITMRVNFARRLLSRDPRAAGDELFRIEELARRTTKEVRQMLFTLRPLILESKGLVAALEHLVSEEREIHRQNVLLEADPEAAQNMEMGKQNVVFYVAEETIANARKHARAANIWVRVYRKGDFFFLEVEDDGTGFDVGAVEDGYEQRGSLGMVNLRERSELVSGSLRIDSAAGRGTHIVLTVPLTAEAVDKLRRVGTQS